MNKKPSNAQIRHAKWVSTIKDCETSGLSICEYCRQHSLSRNAYYYRLRKINAIVSGQTGALEQPAPEKKPITEQDSNAQLIIKTGGVVIGINNDTPTELVSRILELVGHAG